MQETPILHAVFIMNLGSNPLANSCVVIFSWSDSEQGSPSFFSNTIKYFPNTRNCSRSILRWARSFLVCFLFLEILSGNCQRIVIFFWRQSSNPVRTYFHYIANLLGGGSEKIRQGGNLKLLGEHVCETMDSNKYNIPIILTLLTIMSISMSPPWPIVPYPPVRTLEIIENSHYKTKSTFKNKTSYEKQEQNT